MKLFKRYYDNKKLNKKYVSRFEDARKMLLIAPHPDDEVIGCGGILGSLTFFKVSFIKIFKVSLLNSH